MYGVIFALVAIAIRLIAHYAEFQMDPRGIVMLHLFLILLAIFLESSKQVKKTAYDFVNLFKAGMRGGIVYAIITALFVYAYYGHVAPEIFETRNAALLESMKGPEAQEQRDLITEMFTPAKYAQGTFFGYFLMSVFYALLIAVIQRKVLRSIR